MFIAVDDNGKIWMAGNFPHVEELNGIKLTSLELSPEGEAAYLALPADRDEARIDENGFTAQFAQIPAPIPTRWEKVKHFFSGTKPAPALKREPVRVPYQRPETDAT